MTPRAYYIMCVVYVVGFVCVCVSVAAIAFTGSLPWWRWFTLTINALSVWVLVRQWPKTRKLYRDWQARAEGLHQRLAHAIEREDWFDVDLTLQLMRIWNVKPGIEVTRGS